MSEYSAGITLSEYPCLNSIAECLCRKLSGSEYNIEQPVGGITTSPCWRTMSKSEMMKGEKRAGGVEHTDDDEVQEEKESRTPGAERNEQHV